MVANAVVECVAMRLSITVCHMAVEYDMVVRVQCVDVLRTTWIIVWRHHASPKDLAQHAGFELSQDLCRQKMRIGRVV